MSDYTFINVFICSIPFLFLGNVIMRIRSSCKWLFHRNFYYYSIMNGCYYPCYYDSIYENMMKDILNGIWVFKRRQMYDYLGYDYKDKIMKLHIEFDINYGWKIWYWYCLKTVLYHILLKKLRIINNPFKFDLKIYKS